MRPSKQAPQKITFTPLKGGRYRCNQTGEVTRYPKKYRWSKRSDRPSAPAVAKPAEPPPETLLEARFNRLYSEVRCANCNWTNYGVSAVGVRTCPYCNQKFRVV